MMEIDPLMSVHCKNTSIMVYSVYHPIATVMVQILKPSDSILPFSQQYNYIYGLCRNAFNFK